VRSRERRRSTPPISDASELRTLFSWCFFVSDEVRDRRDSGCADGTVKTTGTTLFIEKYDF